MQIQCSIHILAKLKINETLENLAYRQALNIYR